MDRVRGRDEDLVCLGYGYPGLARRHRKGAEVHGVHGHDVLDPRLRAVVGHAVEGERPAEGVLV